VHPYLMQTLSADRIRDWQQRAEQARWIKEARQGRPARHPRPARQLVAAALEPLGIRRVPPARPMAGRTGTTERQSAAADRRRSGGTR
jgi:hypothetical protein